MATLEPPRFELVELRTPPIRCLVPDSVFDAFEWATSTTILWRRGEDWESQTPTTGINPAGMAFVFTRDCTYLPREQARLHVGTLAGPDEWALAPYAIDDATDELHRHRDTPGDLLCLAARHLDALVWGLHDWCHFHNHGSFERPAWTEVQCDASALVWLWQNRESVGLSVRDWHERRGQLERVARQRFDEEGLAFETRAYEAEQLLDLAKAHSSR